MRPMMIMIATLATVVLFGSNVVLAEETDHSKMDHSNMDHSKMDMAEKTQASGKGVINSVNTEGRSINVTHEPMPDLGWPKMTMNLPVTRKVDLSNTNIGDAVSFTIKLGRDKKYRVIELSPIKQ